MQPGRGKQQNRGVMTPVASRKRVKKNAAKSPAVVPGVDSQAPVMEPDASQKEMMHAPDIMELLQDISSGLQTTEHYIQAMQKHHANADGAVEMPSQQIRETPSPPIKETPSPSIRETPGSSNPS